MTTLQDIMGLITKRKIKTPSDNDYIISAAYTDTQERLKPQPKMEANLLSLGAIKNHIVSSIAPPKYKVYTAIVTAWDNDAPVAIELENTIGAITISSIGNGRYYIESDSLFTEYKTVLFYGSISKKDEYASDPQLISSWQTISRIRLDTLIGGTESNFVIWETPIEIRVYN